VVEAKNAKSEVFTASFTSAPAGKSPFADHVDTFAAAVCTHMEASNRQLFQPYLRRLLNASLQHCHGTLLAAHTIPAGGLCPESLSDGVWLSPPLDLVGTFIAAHDGKDAESLAALQASEALLGGMINSDGLVIFGTNGTILGFRVFLKPTDDEKKAASHKGGGRRRTYELMKIRLGIDLKAAFFRSQDGETACERVA
jgi:hypothetical protein